MPTAPTTIPPIPTPVPSTDDPANFDTRADATLTAMPATVDGMNAAGSVAYDNAVEAAASAATATAEALAAATNALAAVGATGYMRRSTATLAIGTGAKAVTGLNSPSAASFADGDEITLIDAGNAENRMWGVASGTNAGAGTTTVTVASGDYAGTGSPANWIVIHRAFESLLSAQVADIWAGTTKTLGFTPGDFYASAAEVTLTDAATVVTPGDAALDFGKMMNGRIILGGNRTIPNPINAKPGQTGYIAVVQPSSGGPYTPALGGNWKRSGGTPTFSTAANAIDFLKFEVITSNYILYSFPKAPS